MPSGAARLCGPCDTEAGRSCNGARLPREDTLRRTLAAVLVTMGLAAGSAGPVSAAQDVSRQVTGPVSGIERPEIQTNGCSFVYEEWHLTVASAKGGTLEFKGCLTPMRNNRYRFAGTFVYCAFNGATMSGATAGDLYLDYTYNDFEVAFTFTVATATRQLRSLVGNQYSFTASDFDFVTRSFTGHVEAVSA